MGRVLVLNTPPALSSTAVAGVRSSSLEMASDQGLTLVHFSAQRKRFLWDRGCIEGLLRGYFAGV